MSGLWAKATKKGESYIFTICPHEWPSYTESTKVFCFFSYHVWNGWQLLYVLPLFKLIVGLNSLFTPPSRGDDVSGCTPMEGYMQKKNSKGEIKLRFELCYVYLCFIYIMYSVKRDMAHTFYLNQIVFIKECYSSTSLLLVLLGFAGYKTIVSLPTNARVPLVPVKWKKQYKWKV